MQPPRLFIMATEVVGLFLFAAAAGISAARAGQIYTHSPLTLRGGPDDGFAVTEKVDSGTQIDVLWCNGGSSWCLVQHETGQGWAPITSLKADGMASPGLSRGLGDDDDDPGNARIRKPGRGADVADNSPDSGRGSDRSSARGSSATGSIGRGGSDNGNSGAGAGNNGGGRGNGNGNGGGGSNHGGVAASVSVGGGGVGVSISAGRGSVRTGR